jgi:hypothetical protein
MPSVWYVAKFSFSFDVCCQFVFRSTPLNVSRREVLESWWLPDSLLLPSCWRGDERKVKRTWE